MKEYGPPKASTVSEVVRGSITDSYVELAKNLNAVIAWANQVSQQRRDDIIETGNLPNIFLRGRKVDRVPSAYNDVLATDAENDFNWNATSLYILVNNSGTLEWRYVTLTAV
jgi:hypothetical protein